MHDEPPSTRGTMLERAIMLQLLSDEQEQRCSRAQLVATLEREAEALEQALSRLAEAGVVCIDGPEVWASPAARYIDALGLIGI
jgi:DNA-binding TFAR19-related protein (PDSD5 family)